MSKRISPIASALLFVAANLLFSVVCSSSVSAPASAAAERVMIPNSAVAIWHAIDTQSATLEASIDSRKLAGVHHAAFAIRDLAQGLAARSPNLPADSLAKVRAQVNFVVILAQRLDVTGDANDLAGTQQNYAKLLRVLAAMKATYQPAAK